MVNEYDIPTEHEIYCIIAIFGLEFAINYGGPDIDGYIKWLNMNSYNSSLHYGNNTNFHRCRHLYEYCKQLSTGCKQGLTQPIHPSGYYLASLGLLLAFRLA